MVLPSAVRRGADPLAPAAWARSTRPSDRLDGRPVLIRWSSGRPATLDDHHDHALVGRALRAAERDRGGAEPENDEEPRERESEDPRAGRSGSRQRAAAAVSFTCDRLGVALLRCWGCRSRWFDERRFPRGLQLVQLGNTEHHRHHRITEVCAGCRGELEGGLVGGLAADRTERSAELGRGGEALRRILRERTREQCAELGRDVVAQRVEPWWNVLHHARDGLVRLVGAEGVYAAQKLVEAERGRVDVGRGRRRNAIEHLRRQGHRSLPLGANPPT